MAAPFKRSYSTTDPKTGRKVRRKSSHYYGWFTDADGVRRRVKLARDKAASQSMLNELTLRADRQKHGLADPFEDHAKRPLAKHLDDFDRHLRDKGNTASHCRQLVKRARRVVEGCRFRFIADVSASRVEAFLADLRRGTRDEPGLSQQTVNHYLRAAKQFTRWLVRDHRTADDRLAHLQGGNVRTDRRLERRELDDDELQRLLDTARTGGDRLGMAGPQRFLLYAVAVSTGLRASELASLTPKHFDLDADIPAVRIDAADDKARRGDVLPLPANLVVVLRPSLAGIEADALVWPGPWAEQKRASKFIRFDLNVARSAWINETDDEAERAARERSGFLRYRDDDRGQADFHALRHTFLSRLGRSGASAKAMQRLARHSTVELTIGRYTHAGLFDLATAVNEMPALPTGPVTNGVEALPMRATGTDDARAERATIPLAHQLDQIGPKLARTGDADATR